MFKVFLFLSICLAVGHKVNSANTNRAVSPRSDGDISFVEDDNEMDFKQRIQSDTDRFKSLKEMAMKAKKTVLVTAPEATTASLNDCTPETALLLLPTTSLDVMTSQNDVTDAQKSLTVTELVPSSTIRQISFNLGNDDEEDENTEQTTLENMPGTLENRFILSAPQICSSGRKVDAEGKCRAVI
ncbi:unnamed protein product [Diamesa serratosioi]